MELTPLRPGLSVLVVDDQVDVADALKLLLESFGARAAVVSDGLMALEALHRFHPDVIVCDLQMPRLNGRDFVARLRADPKHDDIPVIAMSGVPQQTNDRLLGFDGRVGKPVDLPALLAAIRRVTRHLGLPIGVQHARWTQTWAGIRAAQRVALHVRADRAARQSMRASGGESPRRVA